MKEYLSAALVAKEIGLDRRTIHYFIRSGQMIPDITIRDTAGKCAYGFKRETVEKYKAKHKAQAGLPRRYKREFIK